MDSFDYMILPMVKVFVHPYSLLAALMVVIIALTKSIKTFLLAKSGPNQIQRDYFPMSVRLHAVD